MSLPEDFFLLSFSTPSLLPSSSSAPEDLQISPAISETHTADTTALRKWHELVTWPGSRYLQWHNRNETLFSHQTIVILQWFVCSPCANRAANTLYFLCLCFVWILTQPTYICLHHGFLFQNKTYHQTSPVSSPYLLISGYRSLWPFHRFLCLAPYLCQYI